MGLTRIKGFSGEAELLGSLREVDYHDEMLVVRGLGLDDAYAILDALRTGQLSAVRVRGIEAPAPTKDAVPSQRKEATADAKRSSEDPVGKLNGKAKHADDPALVFPPSETGPAEAELKLAEELKGVPDPGAEGAGGVPAAIVKTGRFFDVLGWVMKSKGLKRTQVDEIVAVCEALKETVPAVRRVRDLRDKVTSNLEAYEEAGEAP